MMFVVVVDCWCVLLSVAWCVLIVVRCLLVAWVLIVVRCVS